VRHCNQCGYLLDARMTFCPQCGARVYDYIDQEETSGSKGPAIASLVLGILNVFLWVIPLIGLASTIVGVALGAKGRGNGMATAGLVLNIIFLVFSAIGTFILACTGGFAGCASLIGG
jgi:hypothetical protein